MANLATSVGAVALANPIMTASGTAGHGAELGAYIDLSRLGAVVVKSLSVMPWAGNAAPRVIPLPGSMMNSVGLQGPGVKGWIENDLPALVDAGASIVASIWGRSIEEYRQAAEALTMVQDQLTAVEINVSCPNLEDRRRMFSRSAESAAEVIDATEAISIPRWAKLSPNVADIAEIAAGAHEAGAAAVTLTNTLLGLDIDAHTGSPSLGGGGGGVSGPAVRAVAQRAVFDVAANHPQIPVIGVGGIAAAEHVVQYLRAGASAVQIGTATFADPRATAKILRDLDRWCDKQGVTDLSALVGTAHS